MQVVCLFVHVIVKIQAEGECFSWQCWLFVCLCMSLWRSKLKENPLLMAMNDELFVCACDCACSVHPLLRAWMTGCLFVHAMWLCRCEHMHTEKHTRILTVPWRLQNQCWLDLMYPARWWSLGVFLCPAFSSSKGGEDLAEQYMKHGGVFFPLEEIGEPVKER
jgi:hypothetical protein